MKKNISRALSLLLVLVMILGAMPVALATEGGDGDGAGTPPVITVPNSVTVIASPTNPKVGQEVTFAAIIPDGFTASNIVWVGADGTSTSATKTFNAAGNQSIVVTMTLTSTTDATATGTASGSASVTVAPETVPATGIVISGGTTVGIDDALPLTAVPVPPDATLEGAATWTSSALTVATVSTGGVVTGKAAGKTVITASWGGFTATKEVTVTKGQATLTAKAAVTISPNQNDVNVGASISPKGAQTYCTAKYTTSNKNIVTVDGNGNLTGKSAGTATVTTTVTMDANAKYELAGGVTKLTYETVVTVDDQYYIKCESKSAGTGSYMTLTPYLYDGNGKIVPTATFNYTVSSNKCNVRTSDYKNFDLSSNTSGAYTITFTTKDGDNNDLSKTVTVGFYETNNLKVSLRSNVSSFWFNEDGIFQTASRNSQNISNAVSYDMADLIGMSMDYDSQTAAHYYAFSMSSASGGELLEPTSGSSSWNSSNKYVAVSNLENVGFRLKNSNNGSSFTIYATYGSPSSSNYVIVGRLNVELNGGTTSGIEYSTTYNKSVTFSASDFQQYWNASKYNNSYNNNSSLSYVVFGVTNTVPSYGTLYATASANAAKVTQGMKFYVSNYNNNSNSYNYALSGVTYVPSTNYTSAYTVDIPFTAYGTNGDTLSGYVTIRLNEKGSTIGARGTTLDTSVAESIAANYYAAKGQTLGYVTFELPSAQQGTLYRSIPKVDGYSRVTEASRVLSGDRFYYYSTYNYNDYNQYTQSGIYNQYFGNNSTYDCGCHNQYYCTNTYCKYYDGNNSNTDCGCHNQYYCTNSYCKYYDGNSQYNNNNYNNNNNQYTANQMKLTDVSIVPAAGFSGKLTLSYTAYNAGGAYPYTGYVTFDVETKSTSAVFSDVKGSYSWAADSADFLYYEGTAQGSNGKYNPSANITRGDFMLMLYRAFLAEDYGTTAVTGNFSDMTEGTTSYSKETYKAVGIAKQLGIAQGTNNKFNPKSNITREEAMVLIYRTLNEIDRTLRYRASGSASSFSDYSKISSWATTAISDLVSHGVIQGSNNRITPKSNITRAEMACILHRVITY